MTAMSQYFDDWWHDDFQPTDERLVGWLNSFLCDIVY